VISKSWNELQILAVIGIVTKTVTKSLLIYATIIGEVSKSIKKLNITKNLDVNYTQDFVI